MRQDQGSNMTIRVKLLVLLLVTALLPMLASTVLHWVSMHRLGRQLGSDKRVQLTEQAHLQLQKLVGNYGRALASDRKALELALHIQAREVEYRLAGEAPASPEIFLPGDYDDGANLPKGMELSEKHFRATPDKRISPIPVTYQEQVYFVIAGVEKDAVAEDMARLSTMPEVYQFVYDSNPDLIYWQYTALESGFHTSYPGHGG